MDALTKIKEDAFRRELSRGMAARLQATYDALLTQPLPPRLQELAQRLDTIFDDAQRGNSQAGKAGWARR